MAAAELGLPPGYRFMPTDDELVKYCLVSRILGQTLPPGDIINQEDPLSGAPWDLLAKHRWKEEAFFFSEVQAVNAKSNREKRTCVGGGTWEGQGKRKRREDEEEEGKKLLRVHGCDEKVEWEKYVLNFHEASVKGSTGWVMHEYSVTAPPELARSPVRLYRIRFSGHGQNAKKRKRDEQDWGSDVDEDDAAAAAPATTKMCAVEDDPVAPLFIGEYPSAPQTEYAASFPAVAADVVTGNAADGMGAGADNDQDFAVFVDFEGNLQFIDSLPNFDLYCSQ